MEQFLIIYGFCSRSFFFIRGLWRESEASKARISSRMWTTTCKSCTSIDRSHNHNKSDLSLVYITEVNRTNIVEARSCRSICTLHKPFLNFVHPIIHLYLHYTFRNTNTAPTCTNHITRLQHDSQTHSQLGRIQCSTCYAGVSRSRLHGIMVYVVDIFWTRCGHVVETTTTTTTSRIRPHNYFGSKLSNTFNFVLL